MVDRGNTETGWALPFFTLWGGQAASLLGSALVDFALVWWLTERTGSATVLALAMLAAILPRVLIGPFAGALVDRWDRRVVMLAADAQIALVTLALAALFALGAVQPGHVYVVLLLRALGEAFHFPAMGASTSLMVPREHLARIGGLNQALNGAMNIAAPPLGALLIAALPVQGVLAIDVITAGIAITVLALIAVPQPERAPAAATVWRTVRADFATGLRYVWAWPGLRALVVLAMAINFTTFPATALLPLLVREHFGGAALQLGWMQSGWGVGMLAGGILLGVCGGFRRRMVTSMVGLVGMGGGFLIVGALPGAAFMLALVAMTYAGVMSAIHGGPIFAAIQAAVDPALQGRVLALITSAFMAVAPLSLLLAGPLADWLGVNIWYTLSGVQAIVLGAGAFAVPALMAFEDGRESDVVKSGSEMHGSVPLA